MTYVYAIGDADHRHVKIGYTNDPQRRLRNIRITCPFAVSILWHTEGGVILEDALHGYFADYHSFGEWFEFPAGQNAVELIGQAAEAIAKGAQVPVDDAPALRTEDGEPAEVADCDVQAPPDEGVLARLIRAVDATIILEGHIIDRLMQLEQRVGGPERTVLGALDGT